MREASVDSSPRSAQVLSEVALYLKQIRGTPLLSAEEERSLGWAIINNKCSRSRQQLITSNLRLVIAIAKLFRGRGMDLLELVAEGNIGLLRAVDGFDPAYGTRFSTYACWWIKQSIRRALVNSEQSIHIPQYMAANVARWKLAIRRLEGTLDREPAREDIAAEMNLPLNKIRRIEYASEALETSSQEPVDTAGDLVSISTLSTDDRSVAPVDYVLRIESLQSIHRLLGDIDERARLILLLRFGLQGRQPLPLSQIARELGITRERVRQIANETLRKLGAQMCDDDRGPLVGVSPLGRGARGRAARDDMGRRSLSRTTRRASRARPRRTPIGGLVMSNTPRPMHEAHAQ